VIKALKEKEKVETSPFTIEDLESIIDTLKKLNTKVKTIKIKKTEKRRQGMDCLTLERRTTQGQ
jgi:hypothetical protein